MTVQRTAAGTRRPGFQTLDEEVPAHRLEPRGDVPAWLAGTLVRVTPALLDVGGRPLRHWFDGLAMLNAFTFTGGRVSYANRYLRTEAYREAREGRLSFRGFAQDPCRSLFKRVTTMVAPPRNDNTNVNLTRLGDRYVAMTELPLPVEFDPATLDTLGLREWEDRLGGQVTTAHPHHDPERNEAINYVTRFSRRSSYRVFAVPSGSSSRREIARITTRRPSYMHSFGMSGRYVILAEYPLVVDPLRLALSGRPFIDNYRWEPDRGTRFTVVDRHTGELRGTYEGEPFFCFHHVNAFERERELVVDLVAFEDPSVIRALEVERLRAPAASVPGGTLRRYRIDLESGAVAGEQVADAALELPRIHYRAANARDYRFVYAAGMRGRESDWLDRIVKVDVATGEVRAWDEQGCYPGEPVFVPAPEARGEDGGVVLSVVLDSGRGRSFVVVLDAVTLEELARAEAPHHIPFGFHGQFFGGVA